MKKIITLALILATSFAQAANQGWTTYSKVVEVVVTVNGGINVRLFPELSGCTSQSGYGARYASIYPDHPGIDKIQSTLLSAYMADKEVRLYFINTECKVYEVRLGGR